MNFVIKYEHKRLNFKYINMAKKDIEEEEDLPRNTWLLSFPSKVKLSGILAPAKAQKLGSKSLAESIDFSSTLPAGVCPGQRTMKGIRVPPSYSESFEPRKFPDRDPLKLGSGPLSLVKTTSVF